MVALAIYARAKWDTNVDIWQFEGAEIQTEIYLERQFESAFIRNKPGYASLAEIKLWCNNITPQDNNTFEAFLRKLGQDEETAWSQGDSVNPISWLGQLRIRIVAALTVVAKFPSDGHENPNTRDARPFVQMIREEAERIRPA